MANLNWKDRKRTSEHYYVLQIDLLWLVMWLKSIMIGYVIEVHVMIGYVIDVNVRIGYVIQVHVT